MAQDSGDDTVLKDDAEDPHFGATTRTSHPGKTRLEAAAVKIGVDDIFDEGSPEAVALRYMLQPGGTPSRVAAWMGLFQPGPNRE